MSDCAAEDCPLGHLTALETADGSLSLHSDHFQEAFHSSVGALEEARAKFAQPAELQRFLAGSTLRVLDVCVGLGYNSAALMSELEERQGPMAPEEAPRLDWWGLELDRRPLAMALAHAPFLKLWPEPVRHRLEALQRNGGWQDRTSAGTILWGDARQTLKQLPLPFGFDLILHDAFSPSRCPELWSEEFLRGLAERLAPGGRLLTYSRAAAVRGSLGRAGLELRSLLPAPGQRKEWSSGTLASRPNPRDPLPDYGPGWQPLTTMEQEHLQTRAAIPYRDPGGTDKAASIQQCRQDEQGRCTLESTSRWQRRWIHRVASMG